MVARKFLLNWHFKNFIPLTLHLSKLTLHWTKVLDYTGCLKKNGIDKKTFIRSCSRLQFTVFEFIWIQYICKFCLVFHLKDLDASRQVTAAFRRRTCF